MGFSKEWEDQYTQQHQMSIWPWSDLVSYIYRYTEVPKRSNVKVLEIGCGAGANIRLFQELDADYYGVDGSLTIVERLKQRFPKYSDHFRTGDFTKAIPFEGKFDVIIDRAALTHNTTTDIKNTILLLKQLMYHEKSLFIGIDWFSTNHDDFQLGVPMIDDIHTKYMGAVKGQFANVGNVHFSDSNHLKELFKDFEIKVMEEKIVHTMVPLEHRFAAWNFVAKLG